MMNISVEVRNALYLAGRTARLAEMPRATASDLRFAEIAFKDNARPDTKTFQVLCDEWYEGFDHETDNIIATMFEDDDYFADKAVKNRISREARLMRLGA